MKGRNLDARTQFPHSLDTDHVDSLPDIWKHLSCPQIHLLLFLETKDGLGFTQVLIYIDSVKRWKDKYFLLE